MQDQDDEFLPDLSLGPQTTVGPAAFSENAEIQCCHMLYDGKNALINMVLTVSRETF